VLGHFNAGFSAQDFTASLVLQADERLRFKPATRVENACATGSAAVRQGIRALEARAARVVLVVGAEQMTTTPAPEIGRNLLRASYLAEEGQIPAGFAGVFGQIAAAYFQRYGDQSDALAAIAAKNHRNGVDNPYAQMRKDLGYAFCRTESEKNPFVAGPLKRTDCSLVSDGAAALVIADVETALAMPHQHRLIAFDHHAARAGVVIDRAAQVVREQPGRRVPAEELASVLLLEQADAGRVGVAQFHDQLGQFLRHAMRIDGKLAGECGHGPVLGRMIRRPARTPLQFRRDDDVVDAGHGG